MSARAPSPSPNPSAAAIRAELGIIKAAVARAESALDSLEDDGGRVVRKRRRPDRYYLVLLGIYERGRQGVDSEEFGALGARHGYDPRGLGGFFVGARASLRQEASRIFLSAEGVKLVDEYLQDTV